MYFYNDNDRAACAWLRELMADGHLAEGKVDERRIQEIKGHELHGYLQCHFFAGIGGWTYALQLAGWPASRPVWTGSCPCQPFSAAGKRKGQEDERHLWPVFLRLIRECQPATIFGEQVASDDGYRWLARVRDDLEEAGYAVGCADLPACCAGAPHIRQRLFWVADACSGTGQWNPRTILGKEEGKRCEDREKYGDCPKRSGNGRTTDGLDDANNKRREAGAGAGAGDNQEPFWANQGIVHCRDGKARRVEPGIFPLADRIPGRVGLLRGAGNAIVPQVAAKFIKAFLEAIL